jgi:hypothetical protein
MPMIGDKSARTALGVIMAVLAPATAWSRPGVSGAGTRVKLRWEERLLKTSRQRTLAVSQFVACTESGSRIMAKLGNLAVGASAWPDGPTPLKPPAGPVGGWTGPSPILELA